MSSAVLAWTALVVGSLLWDLSGASRAWANPPRNPARRGEKGWWLQQVIYVSGYFLVLLGLLALQRAQGWSTLPLGLPALSRRPAQVAPIT